MIIITLNCDAAFIVNVFGGQNEYDVNFKFDNKRNSKKILIVIPIYFISLEFISRIIHYGQKDYCALFWVPFLQFVT